MRKSWGEATAVAGRPPYRRRDGGIAYPSSDRFAAQAAPSGDVYQDDAVAVPKQDGAQGFYKVWVSDAPIKAE